MLGKKIQKLRKKKELTQQDLADKLNVSFKTVSSWENERTLPSVDMIYYLSKALGVKVDDLITDDVNKEYQIDKKSQKYLTELYLLLLLIVPIIYFGIEFYNLFTVMTTSNVSSGNEWLIETIKNGEFLEYIIFSISLKYVGYIVVQIINYIIFMRKNNKLLLIATIVEFILWLVLLWPHNFQINLGWEILSIVPIITNICLYFINKKN